MNISDVKVGDLYAHPSNTKEITYFRVLVWDAVKGCALQVNQSNYIAVNHNQLSAIGIIEASRKITEKEYEESMDLHWKNIKDQTSRQRDYQVFLDDPHLTDMEKYEYTGDSEHSEAGVTLKIDDITDDVTLEFQGKKVVIKKDGGATEYLMCVRVQRAQLIFYKNDGREPSKELLRDIECLDYICDEGTITSQNKKAAQYLVEAEKGEYPRNILAKFKKDKVWK